MNEDNDANGETLPEADEENKESDRVDHLYDKSEAETNVKENDCYESQDFSSPVIQQIVITHW